MKNIRKIIQKIIYSFFYFILIYNIIYIQKQIMKFNINKYKITSNKTKLNDWYQHSEIYWKQ